MTEVEREAYNAKMAAYMLERYHRRRAVAIEQLGGKCVDCGTTEDLEFDHAEASTKKLSMAKILSSGSEAKVQAELAKCVLRCNDCHKKKSRTAGDWKLVEHGGGKAGKRNCMCDPCRSRRSEYMRSYNKRRPARDHASRA